MKERGIRLKDKKWTVDDIPDLWRNLVVVTGASSGIGYETAVALAGKGAKVFLAVRRLEKGREALARIRQKHPRAAVEAMALDLADLRSVRRFAGDFRERYGALSLLINNAGVMAIPLRRTADGFEMQMGTNHLGHFALTGLLMPVLLSAPAARVVTVSSLAHVVSHIDFDNLNGAKRYLAWGTYNQSKLANVLFAYELQRRFAAAGAGAISVSCHPGYAATNLQAVGPQMSGSRLLEIVFRLTNRVLAQSAAMGALPTLYAATAPEVAGGDFIGPTALAGMRGHPGKARSSAQSYDVLTAKQLWQISEEVTGVHYDLESDDKRLTQTTGLPSQLSDWKVHGN